jgi:flavin-dependent dehydrogenase
MTKEKVDVLVIGAGPAGCVAAAILNKKGHSVKVVEKQQFPRFVIGESLLPRCLDNLEKAGLLEAVQAQNFQRKNGASFVRDEGEVCEFDFSEQHTKGWEYAWQMRRSEFDKALADEIERQGVKLTYQESVEAVEFDEEKALVTIKNKVGKSYQTEAKFVVDASGYGRVLPRLLDLNKASDFPARTAFFAHIKDENRIAGTEFLTEVADIKKAWTWIIPVAPGVTSIGFVGDTEFLESYGKNFDKDTFLSLLKSHPKLDNRYSENLEFLTEPKVLKGYSVGVKQMYGERYVLVGNSTEFLDPVFSSGVAFATETGAVAGELVSKQLKGEDVDWDKDYVEYIQHGINVFRTYVKEWYNGNLQTVFFAADKNQGFKNQICSVLAGYVWDMSNPYVKKHKRAVTALAHVIRNQKLANME